MFVKQLIIIGKMLVALQDKMNIFGLWQSTNYMAQAKALAVLARSLQLLNLAQQKLQARSLLLANLAAKNN